MWSLMSCTCIRGSLVGMFDTCHQLESVTLDNRYRMLYWFKGRLNRHLVSIWSIGRWHWPNVRREGCKRCIGNRLKRSIRCKEPDNRYIRLVGIVYRGIYSLCSWLDFLGIKYREIGILSIGFCLKQNDSQHIGNSQFDCIWDILSGTGSRN